ncbi:YibE/F family protein [Conexibacter sp. W3-3-2]|nr:YibE/F family protein [Conexibacter sp. W3-3-2]
MSARPACDRPPAARARRARRALRALWAIPAGRLALTAVGVIAAATALGLFVLWPGDGAVAGSSPGADARGAEVVAVGTDGCRPELGPGCRTLRIELDGRASTATFAGDALTPLPEPGARIRVVPAVPVGAGEGATPPWVFLDYDRRAPLLLLSLLFAVVIVLLARRRGLLALIGLGASLALLATFVVPAILDGRPPIAVALVGAVAILLVTLALAHGASSMTLAAIIGSACTLVLTALLATLAVDAVQLTGLVSEQAFVLRVASDGEIEPQGLLLAGMVIGALGVLDDVTVSQASVVAALRRAAPSMPARTLYAEALRVGRDHLAATVNTLALAYAGAALPILLVFSTVGTSLGDAVNREIVAQEVTALLVGSIGLACAVPLTTAVAVALARRVPTELLGDAHAGHAH